MQAMAGNGQFKTSGAGGADTISKDRVPQCCCFWGETWGDAWGERDQHSWAGGCGRGYGVTCSNLGSDQSTKRMPACLPLKYTSLGKLPGKNWAKKPQNNKPPKTPNQNKQQTRAFAEMLPGLSDSELLHWSARFANDPSCFSLVVAGWDLQWILFCHPQMCTSSSWIFRMAPVGTKAVGAMDQPTEWKRRFEGKDKGFF